jgi:hypothetical protein
MTNIVLDLKYIQQEIAALILLHPELEEDDILRADSIEGETRAFEFLARIVRKIGATRALADGTAEYIGQLQERKARFERREQALRAFCFKVMNTADLKKVELSEATLSIRAGQPKVVIINEHEIPDAFMRIKKEPDKTKIKTALQANEYVAGTALSNSEPALTIRTK